MLSIDNFNISRKIKGGSILIIDDEASFVDVTKILLELAGFTVFTAYNGLEGIESFNKNKDFLDVVICDLNMPKLGGHAAVKTFLSLKPEIKILIISGSIMEEDVPTYIESGKVAFLRKPFTMEVLLETLRHLLG